MREAAFKLGVNESTPKSLTLLCVVDSHREGERETEQMPSFDYRELCSRWSERSGAVSGVSIDGGEECTL